MRRVLRFIRTGSLLKPRPDGWAWERLVRGPPAVLGPAQGGRHGAAAVGAGAGSAGVDATPRRQERGLDEKE